VEPAPASQPRASMLELEPPFSLAAPEGASADRTLLISYARFSILKASRRTSTKASRLRCLI
jgi:hypothetical protein